MHRWHHSVMQEENDRNFSNCLTLWDRFSWNLTPLRPILRFKHTTLLLPPERLHPEEIGLHNNIPKVLQDKDCTYTLHVHKLHANFIVAFEPGFPKRYE